MAIRCTGVWYGDVFLKITKTQYFYKKVGGYAIDADVIDNCDHTTAQIWLAISDSYGEAYFTDPATILRHSTIINHEGQGKQYVLPMGKWKKLDGAVEEIGGLIDAWGLVNHLKKTARKIK